MDDPSTDGTKIHYICQTYTATSGKADGLKVDKLFEYTTATQAEDRARREVETGRATGADAYMLIEDQGSGEVSDPQFLGRFGTVPELDD